MKKKSAIKEIFYGRKGVVDTILMPKEHFKNKDKFNSLHEELSAKLSPELWELHKKAVDIIEDNIAEELEIYFAQGFKLGLQIGVECLED